MPLELERPLITFDIESTGTDVVLDRIISLAAVKIVPEDFVQPAERIKKEWLFNPGQHIPAESTEVHGITFEHVKDKPLFKSLADYIFKFFSGADLCGYNLLKFDVPILYEEFYRCGLDWNLEGVRIVDVSEIFRRKEPRDLSSAVKKFCNREHTGAHEAMADVVATLDVLEGQRSHYQDIGQMNVAALAEFSSAEEFRGKPAKRLDLAGYIIEDSEGIARFTLKKVRGVAVKDDFGFANWMLKNTFPSDTKNVIKKILLA